MDIINDNTGAVQVIGPGGVAQTFVAVDPLVEVVTISIVPLDDPLTLTQIEVSIHEGVGC